MVAIPESNRLSISDAYILDGIKSLYRIQIFTLDTFEDASALANVERDEKIQQGLDEFAQVQTVLKKNPKYVYNKKVQEKLKTVYKAMPNHLSAKLLLLHGMRKGPSQLSLVGSLTGIDNAGSQLGIMLKNNSYMNSGGNDDVLSRLVTDLQRLRPKLDKRTWGYADAYRNLAEFIQDVRGRKTWNTQLEREFNSTLSNVNGGSATSFSTNPRFKKNSTADKPQLSTQLSNFVPKRRRGRTPGPRPSACIGTGGQPPM